MSCKGFNYGINMWFVYILLCSDNTFYTGITNDLERRLFEHNNLSKWAKYTKARRPVELIYSKVLNTKSEALKEEYRIKQLTRKQKEELLNNKL